LENNIFEEFRELIYKESGISLSLDKKPLLENRIGRRLRALGVASHSEYLKIIETDHSGEELINLIDVVSTNVTFFYREPAHFEVLSTILEGYKAENRNKVRIWCAAASSGEEPWTLAMTAAEHLNLQKTDLKILATDICTTVLKKAIAGQYQENQLEKVPNKLKNKYFHKISSEDGESWSVNDNLRELLLYRKLNLAKFPYPLKSQVNIIFIRNVMIYFKKELRQLIINQMYPMLAPGGYLFLSHSENLLGIDHKLKTVQTAVFRKDSL